MLKKLAATMRLQPGQAGRKLLIRTEERKEPLVCLTESGPSICTVFPPVNESMLAIAMSRVGLTVVRALQPQGGMLLHGALAAFPSLLSGHRADREPVRGVLLVGPGNVGKTTASNRLPPPWQALSDDTTLVLPDRYGQYWAHPWPTWSRFYSNSVEPAQGGSWDVQRGVPLQAIFFLYQSSRDRVEPYNPAWSMALLMDAVQQVGWNMIISMGENEIRSNYQEQLRAVENMMQVVPAFRLCVSLNGEFWKEMKRVLDKIPHQTKSRLTQPVLPSKKGNSFGSTSEDGFHYIVYTGPSMNPTLREPDLLKVEPYKGRPVKCGDVICFHSPQNAQRIVHRVTQRSPEGIRTRGDNNSREDPYLLQPRDIIGKVKSAQKQSRSRNICAGFAGIVTGYACRLRRLLRIRFFNIMHTFYRFMANSGVVQRLLPLRLQPRVFVFRCRQQYLYKCIMGRRVIGKYDNRKGIWQIDRPYRLFLREAALPQPGSEFSQELQPKA